MSLLSQQLNDQNQVGRSGDYETTIQQLKSLFAAENNLIANLANTASLLKHNHKYFWVGFYLIDTTSINKELVLGPFQGTLACTRIPYGRGVCGTAWKEEKSIFVPNVHEFPGHIACDSKSETEIVILLRNAKSGLPWGVLDVDSDQRGGLSEIDLLGLSEIGKIIETIIVG
jgi:L-methionine (R)-S-oxide reductase